MSESFQIISRSSRYDVLDGMRGIAAITVMIHHFTQYDGHAFFHNANLAVDLFFMLSGFVIAHSYGNRLQKGMSYLEYIGKRFIRLYPMLLLGICIGAPVLYFLAKAGLANNSDRFVLESLFYNAFFLPVFNNVEIYNLGADYITLGAVFPTDPPLWSLFFEMLASFIFPFLFKLKKVALITVIISSYIVLLVIGFVYAFLNDLWAFDLGGGWSTVNFLGGFPRLLFGFTTGLAIYVSINEARFEKYCVFIKTQIKNPYALYILLILIFVFPVGVKGLYPAFMIAIGAPCLVFIGAKMQCTSDFSLRVAKFLGWISYPLYCLHFPIGRVVFFISDKEGYPKILTVFVAIIFSLAAAVILTKLYEEPVRNYFSRKLTRHFCVRKDETVLI